MPSDAVSLITRRERVWRLALLGSAVALLNHLALITFTAHDARLLAAAGNVLLAIEYAFPLLACLLSLRGVPRPGLSRLDPGFRSDVLMAAAFLFMVLGQALWAANRLTNDGLAVASSNDAFIVLGYCAFIAALLVRPTRRTRYARLRLVLDLLVFLVVGALVLWVFGVAPDPAGEVYYLGNAALTVVFPAVAATIAVALVVLVRRGGPSAGQQMFSLLLWLGVAARLLTDAVFAYQFGRGMYVDGGYLDLGYTGATICFTLAWLWRWKHAPVEDAAAGPDRGEANQIGLALWNRFMPQLGLLLVFGLLVWAHFHPNRPDFNVVAAASAAVTMLVTLREIVALKEVDALYRRQRDLADVLQRAHHELERRVAERTAALEQANERMAREAEALRQARADLQASLTEKEALLQEVHHRVKNNLQVVSSLLALQERSTTEPSAVQALLESQARLRAMGLIHQKLYDSGDLSRVNFGDYLRSLADHLLNLYAAQAGRVRVRVQVQTKPLNLDVAVPCGLIVNELVSNALKHAFPGDRPGVVWVTLREQANGRLELSVIDDGVGLPPDFDPEQGASLGLKLIATLARQLGGQLTIDGATGTAYRIVFDGQAGG